MRWKVRQGDVQRRRSFTVNRGRRVELCACETRGEVAEAGWRTGHCEWGGRYFGEREGTVEAASSWGRGIVEVRSVLCKSE